MVRKLSVQDIQKLGFDWPKYPLVEQYAVLEGGKVDLVKTLESMESSHAFYRGQLNQAFRFKQQTGADYSDFTDRFDVYARMERELRQAIAYTRGVMEAVG
jgi:hypothetical protein